MRLLVFCGMGEFFACSAPAPAHPAARGERARCDTLSRHVRRTPALPLDCARTVDRLRRWRGHLWRLAWVQRARLRAHALRAGLPSRNPAVGRRRQFWRAIRAPNWLVAWSATGRRTVTCICDLSGGDG